MLDWENASIAGFAARIDDSNERRGATPDRIDWYEVDGSDSVISTEIE